MSDNFKFTVPQRHRQNCVQCKECGFYKTHVLTNCFVCDTYKHHSVDNNKLQIAKSNSKLFFHVFGITWTIKAVVKKLYLVSIEDVTLLEAIVTLNNTGGPAAVLSSVGVLLAKK